MGRRPNKKNQPPHPRKSGDRQNTAPRATDSRSPLGEPLSVALVVPDRKSAAQTPVTVLSVCGLLLLAVILVFGQTVRHEFVNSDDDLYIYANPQLARGLTVDGITWAFTTADGYFWIPLTCLSYLLDFQLFGLQPWGYHLTNVLLHAASTLLLFLVLWRMTGDLWPSAFVAAVFAIHPLRAESVAWAAERKDVLGVLFFMLTLGAYVRYVRCPFSVVRYLTVMVVFALDLMAKPLAVTLPFLLLLLDYWPLGRMGPSGTGPFFPRWGGSCTAIPGATVQLSPQSVPVNYYLIRQFDRS